MAQKMTGALVFDERTDRYDIRFDLNSYYRNTRKRKTTSMRDCTGIFIMRISTCRLSKTSTPTRAQ